MEKFICFIDIPSMFMLMVFMGNCNIFAETRKEGSVRYSIVEPMNDTENKTGMP